MSNFVREYFELMSSVFREYSWFKKKLLSYLLPEKKNTFKPWHLNTVVSNFLLSRIQIRYELFHINFTRIQIVKSHEWAFSVFFLWAVLNLAISKLYCLYRCH